MHADETPTDDDLVRRLLAAQCPEWADRPVSPVPSAGTENALYRLGDDLVARLPRLRRAEASLHKELVWIPRLAPQLPVPVPVPVAVGTPTDDYPWTWAVYPWIGGHNPVVGDLAEPDGLADDLADFVTALRRVDGAGGPAADRGVPLSQRDRLTRDALVALRGRIPTDAATRAWEQALDAPAWDGPPHWVHGDLSPGNVLVRAGRLGAVIDFGSIGVGDPACDLLFAWNLLPSSARARVRSALEVDDATWTRAKGWALSVALIQLPYYWDTNPTLVDNARHVVAEVLAD
jgi:aminoglycoside phosphotransferase (APT) family kinase protein